MNPIITNEQFLKELEMNQYFDFDEEFDFEIHNRLIFWGVKSLGRNHEFDGDLDFLQDTMYLYQFIMDLLERITPNQLMNMFPIEKVYDGEKYELKDYFSTIEHCKAHGLNKPIGNAFEFLWDYMNTDTGLFLVRYMSFLSDINKLKTGQGILETYAAEMGIKTYKKREVNGRTVMIEKLSFNSKGELL